MKTMIQTLGLLIATLPFTACTEQSIVPTKPARQSPSASSQTDTARIVRTKGENKEQPTQPQYHELVSNEQPVYPTLQPVSAGYPAPEENPLQKVMPTVQADSL